MNNEDTVILPPHGAPLPPPPPTANNAPMPPIPPAANNTNWGQRAAVIAGGGVLGAGVGVAGTVAATHLMDNSEEAEVEPTVDVAPEPVVPIAHVDDNASFAEAFADARAQVGPGGAFEWHGQVYGTYYETEWNQMSPDERAEFQSSVNYEDALSGGGTAHHTDSAAASQTVDMHDIADVSVEDLAHADLDGDGEVDAVAVIDVDGTEIVVADLDGDGIADVAVADLDGDGIISEFEAGEISDADIAMADIEEFGHSASIIEEGIDYVSDVMSDMFEA